MEARSQRVWKKREKAGKGEFSVLQPQLGCLGLSKERG